MDKKTTGIIGYITLIGFLVAYCTGDKEGAKFHLNQSLVLMIVGAVLSIVVTIVSAILGFVFGLMGLGVIGIVLSSLLGFAVSIFTLVLWIMGLLNAANDVEKELPIIGGIRLLK